MSASIVSEFGSVITLSPSRGDEFTHSHTEHFGGGYFCVHDLIVDFEKKVAKMFSGGESCEFKIIAFIS